MHKAAKVLSQPIGLVFVLKRSYNKSAYFHQIGKQPLRYCNVAQQLYGVLEEHGNRLAIVSCQENIRMTYAEAAAEAERLAYKLELLGMQPGDHLGIWTPNTVQWYLTFLAAAIGGYPLVCINPAYQAQEMEYALHKAKVKTLVTMSELGRQNFHAILTKVLHGVHGEKINSPKVPTLQRVLVKSEKDVDGFLNYDKLMREIIPSHNVALMKTKLDKISPDSISNIQFTSGTTGRSKVTLITHFSYVNVGYYFGKYLNMNKSNNICITVPCFHAFGMGIIMGAITHAATLVMPSILFNGAAALEAIEKEKCTTILGTPTMYVDMFEKQRKLNKSMKGLEIGLVGGAACSPEVYKKTKEILQVPDLRIGYGLSETTAAVFVQDGTEDFETAVSTLGKPFEHVEVKVIDDKGETVEFGERGELCVRGFHTMQGYFEDEKATKEALTPNGWLKTGDEFVLEPNGIGRILGRKKDMIIRGGENIFSKEIEDFLDTHENILEAQVIGVPDNRMGEEVCAFLRLKPGSKTLTEEDIRAFSKERIAHFKIPRYVRIVEDFPKTSTGKIQKFKLKELFNATK